MLMIQPPPRAAEVRDRRVAAVEDAAQVRPMHPLPILDAQIGDVCEHADGGVVDEDVESAESGGGRVDGARRIARLLEVGADRDDPAPTCGGLRRGLERRLIASGNRNVRTGRRQRTGDGQADPPRPAGDKRDFACEGLVRYHPRCRVEPSSPSH